NGEITLVGRSKEIFKLSNGLYIAPNKIEDIYNTIPQVSKVFVHARSTWAKLVGIIFIDEKDLTSMSKDILSKNDTEKNYSITDILNSCENYRRQVINLLEKELGSNLLSSGEKVVDWFFSTEIPTVENNLITYTHKIKRNLILAKYEDNLDKLYENYGQS
ncbi:MAG: long-chain-fatty-acid--CoA ligase 2, partial [Paramarteilia canceri]